MKTKKVWKEAKQIFDNMGMEVEKRERNKINFTVLSSIFCPSADDDKVYQFTITFDKSFESFVEQFRKFAEAFDAETETATKVSLESVNQIPTYHQIARWVKCYDGIKTLLMQVSFSINEYLENMNASIKEV